MTHTAKPFWQTFLVFLLPMMAANILQSLQGTINSIFLGRMIGTPALAAASVFFPIMFLFIAFLIGLSAGGSVLIGQAYGAKNMSKVKAISGTLLTVAALGGLVLGITAASFAGPLMQMLGTPDDILVEATAYARASFLSLPAMFLFFISSSLLRGVGDTMTPLYILIVSTVIGALVTPALILGYVGLAPMGAEAAAWASFVAFSASFLILGVYLRWRKHPMAPDAELAANLVPDWKVLALTLRLGVPTGVQMMTGAIAGIIIMKIINGFGSGATAAFGAVNQVASYVQFPAISISIAASIFGAQAIGAGQAGRLKKVTRTALQFNLVLTGALVGIAYLGAEWIIALFVTTPDVAALAQTLLYTMVWSSIVFGAGAVLSGIMRASGTVIVPMFIGIFAIVFVEIPLAFFLADKIGVVGIPWALNANFVAGAVLSLGYYWFVWRKKSVQRLV